MGNAFLCERASCCFKDIKINICLDKRNINGLADQILIKDEELTNKNNIKPIIELKKYFDNKERENFNNSSLKDRDKKLQKKKRQSMFNCLVDNTKYELMLKRLLEQKNEKRNGPKRRETIRKEEDKIKILIKEVLFENKNEKKNSINSNENKSLSANSTLIIKNKNNKKKIHLSVTIDREDLSNMNNINNVNKKVDNNSNQHLKNVNSFNNGNNEGNGSSVVYQKETNKK